MAFRCVVIIFLLLICSWIRIVRRYFSTLIFHQRFISLYMLFFFQGNLSVKQVGFHFYRTGSSYIKYWMREEKKEKSSNKTRKGERWMCISKEVLLFIDEAIFAAKCCTHLNFDFYQFIHLSSNITTHKIVTNTCSESHGCGKMACEKPMNIVWKRIHWIEADWSFYRINMAKPTSSFLFYYQAKKNVCQTENTLHAFKMRSEEILRQSTARHNTRPLPKYYISQFYYIY